MTTRTDLSQLSAVASRIREMREIMGWTPEEMAEKTEVTPAEYLLYERPGYILCIVKRGAFPDDNPD